jgi:hypothetical protein
MKAFLAISLALLTQLSAQAQEASPSERVKSPWRVVLMMANSRIPSATEGGQEVTVIPTWGVDLDYRFSPRWSVALQTDIKMQSFEIEHNQVEIQRNTPVTLALVPHYYANKHWSFMVGPGYELEKTENIFLVKVGAEYGFELTERFELGITAIYENRWEVYDGLTFGASFIFLLGK